VGAAATSGAGLWGIATSFVESGIRPSTGKHSPTPIAGLITHRAPVTSADQVDDSSALLEHGDETI
jgi:hypothetical protein